MGTCGDQGEQEAQSTEQIAPATYVGVPTGRNGHRAMRGAAPAIDRPADRRRLEEPAGGNVLGEVG
jgi:hypothetical protein